MIAPVPHPDTLTHVELIWREKQIEQWIRFGHDVAEQILDRRRRILSFAPGSIFAFVRWAKDPVLSSGGFGAEVREAMDRRIDHLSQQGMAERQGQRVAFARDLINALRRQELDGAASELSAETGLAHRPSTEGEPVSGIYRKRITLSSGRFAMIDDGICFQLVPWRPALEHQLGKQVAGVMSPGGGIDWSFGRKRGLGL